ncbi:MAG: HpcH/HpaI aldolase/citrate lyase family protein [Aquisalimonadaceae bacterium]
MKLPTNTFKQALAQGRTQIGLWNCLCSNVAADVLGSAGFDWIVIDMEHSANDPMTVLSQLQAYEFGGTTPVVRVPWNEPVIVKRILDLGAFSLLFPMVQNAAEAEAAVASTRYPPHGIRGLALNQRGNRFGRIADYVTTVEQEICVLVQIETTAALSRATEIASVEGVDGVFFGPADLSADMGLLGKANHPDVCAAISDGAAKVRAAGKQAGVLTGNEQQALTWLNEGFGFVACGSDLALLANSADSLLARMKEGLKS